MDAAFNFLRTGWVRCAPKQMLSMLLPVWHRGQEAKNWVLLFLALLTLHSDGPPRHRHKDTDRYELRDTQALSYKVF